MKESICNLVPVDRLIGAPEVFPNVDLLRKYSEKANKKNRSYKNLTILSYNVCNLNRQTLRAKQYLLFHVLLLCTFQILILLNV